MTARRGSDAVNEEDAAPPSAPGQARRRPASALSVLERFRILVRAAQRHSQWIERQTGVTGAQLWAMQEIVEEPGLRVGQLAARMAIHQSTASNLADRLEAAELVQRERHGTDQRVVCLRLTPRGEELLRRAPSPARGVLPEALRRLDPAGLERLQRELDALVAGIRDLDRGFGKELFPFND